MLPFEPRGPLKMQRFSDYCGSYLHCKLISFASVLFISTPVAKVGGHVAICEHTFVDPYTRRSRPEIVVGLKRVRISSQCVMYADTDRPSRDAVAFYIKRIPQPDSSRRPDKIHQRCCRRVRVRQFAIYHLFEEIQLETIRQDAIQAIPNGGGSFTQTLAYHPCSFKSLENRRHRISRHHSWRGERVFAGRCAYEERNLDQGTAQYGTRQSTGSQPQHSATTARGHFLGVPLS